MARRGSGTWLRQEYGPACRPQLVQVGLNSGVSRGFDHRTVEAWKAFSEILIAFNYHVRSKDTGVYNCRTTASGGQSPHSWATALDLNWATNPATGGPYGGPNRVITDMPGEMVAALKGIRTKGGVRVFGWGGDYTSFKDAMHWEIIATPGELAAGIDWASVKGAKRDPNDPSTWPVLSLGDTGPTVQELQVRLIEAGYHMGDTGADGQFGPVTHDGVVRYQQDRGLTADGVVGLQTWTALLNRMPPLSPGDAGPVKEQPASPEYAQAVRYSRNAVDERIARGLAAVMHLHVAPFDDERRVGRALLVGGEAVTGYDRSLADEVVEVAGANRDETFTRASEMALAYIRGLT